MEIGSIITREFQIVLPERKLKKSLGEIEIAQLISNVMSCFVWFQYRNVISQTH